MALRPSRLIEQLPQAISIFGPIAALHSSPVPASRYACRARAACTRARMAAEGSPHVSLASLS